MVLAVCQNKFILYSGRLVVVFKDQLNLRSDGHITAAAFNKDSSLLLIGTSAGRILTYCTEDGSVEGTPV